MGGDEQRPVLRVDAQPVDMNRAWINVLDDVTQ